MSSCSLHLTQSTFVFPPTGVPLPALSNHFSNFHLLFFLLSTSRNRTIISSWSSQFESLIIRSWSPPSLSLALSRSWAMTAVALGCWSHTRRCKTTKRSLTEVVAHLRGCRRNARGLLHGSHGDRLWAPPIRQSPILLSQWLISLSLLFSYRLILLFVEN